MEDYKDLIKKIKDPKTKKFFLGLDEYGKKLFARKDYYDKYGKKISVIEGQSLSKDRKYKFVAQENLSDGTWLFSAWNGGYDCGMGITERPLLFETLARKANGDWISAGDAPGLDEHTCTISEAKENFKKFLHYYKTHIMNGKTNP